MDIHQQKMSSIISIKSLDEKDLKCSHFTGSVLHVA